jgi:phosphopantothenoylcysteine decarboxylase / phosphopantothenate---cysteine ligase
VSELSRRGAKTELVDSGIALPTAIEGQLAARHQIRTAFDMQAVLAKRMPKANALVMLAAVADYSPSAYVSGKRKKDGSAWELQLVETVDVLAETAKLRQPGQLLAGVSLEDTDWLERAEKKLKTKNVDLMIAVELGADLPFGDKRLNCALVGAQGVIAEPLQRTKPELALLLADWLAAHL